MILRQSALELRQVGRYDPAYRMSAVSAFHYPPVDRRLLELGCYLTSAGRLRYPPGARYPVSGHPEAYAFDWARGRTLTDFALVLVTGGSGEFETRDGPGVTVAAGSLLYLVPGEWHRYRPRRSTGWTEKWVCANGHYLHDLRAAGLLPARSCHVSDPPAPDLDSAFDRLIEDVHADPDHNRPSWSARALALLLRPFEQPIRAPSPSDAHPVVQRALRFIRENCHRPLDVSTVAAHCGVIRRTLERRFAEGHPRTIAAEIVEARIARAELLLRESRMPLKEIAYACGFESAQRMIYSFRRRHGHPPGRLRDLAH